MDSHIEFNGAATMSTVLRRVSEICHNKRCKYKCVAFYVFQNIQHTYSSRTVASARARWDRCASKVTINRARNLKPPPYVLRLHMGSEAEQIIFLYLVCSSTSASTYSSFWSETDEYFFYHDRSAMKCDTFCLLCMRSW